MIRWPSAPSCGFPSPLTIVSLTGSTAAASSMSSKSTSNKTSLLLNTIFSNLIGSWKFHRIILNEGEVNGIAHFKKMDPFSLHYREEGELVLRNQSFNVYRDYLYKFQDQTISVFFQESPPRLFHDLEFISDRTAKGSHLCGKDTYDAIYEFLSPSSFKINYSIQGPKKNQLIRTNFLRIE